MSDRAPEQLDPRLEAPGFTGERPPRRQSDRLGNAVVRDLAALIATEQFSAGDLLPTEQQLSDHYDVSRTVIRESVKRLQEKGLLRTIQGRGTLVEDRSSWNVLDPIVLSVLIEHDSTIGILDDFAEMRAALEGMMAAGAAERARESDLVALRESLDLMQASVDTAETFGQADAEFHRIVMASADNYLAQNVTQALFTGARGSARFVSNQTSEAFDLTLAEHKAIFDAILDRDAVAAETAMRRHITESWERRRPSDTAPKPRA